MSESLYRTRVDLTVRLFASDWMDARVITEQYTETTIIAGVAVEDGWITSLETYGPSYNQPWTPEADREPPWGSTRRFRAKITLVLAVPGFGSVWEFTEDWKDRLESSDVIENAYFGTVHNMGEIEQIQ